MFENINVQMLLETYVIPWGIALGTAILIFVIGLIAVRLILGVATRMMNKTRLDAMLVSFIASILKFLLLVIVIIAALAELGVNTTSLVALIGAAGLAVGLALQGQLQNFASGSLLIFFKPIAEGEFVEVGGVAGTVEQIHIFHTTLRSPDNKEITVPNGQIFGAVITNYTRRDTRRVDMVFGIGYDDDIDKARRVINEVLDSDDRILDDPAPQVMVDELADSSVNFKVRPWVKTPDYWDVYWNVTEQVKKRFDAEGVSIPYPQMDVHMDKMEAA